MTVKIIRNLGCQNSPKNAFTEMYSLALLRSDQKKLKDYTANNVSFLLPHNNHEISLSELVLNWDSPIQKITCLSAISHGKQASFLATIISKDQLYRVSIHYSFKTLKAEKMDNIIIFIDTIQK